ncbi:MAG: hypothetical protein ABH828_00495, partial [archaeon]
MAKGKKKKTEEGIKNEILKDILSLFREKTKTSAEIEKKIINDIANKLPKKLQPSEINDLKNALLERAVYEYLKKRVSTNWLNSHFKRKIKTERIADFLKDENKEMKEFLESVDKDALKRALGKYHQEYLTEGIKRFEDLKKEFRKEVLEDDNSLKKIAENSDNFRNVLRAFGIKLSAAGYVVNLDDEYKVEVLEELWEPLKDYIEKKKDRERTEKFKKADELKRQRLSGKYYKKDLKEFRRLFKPLDKKAGEFRTKAREIAGRGFSQNMQDLWDTSPQHISNLGRAGNLLLQNFDSKARDNYSLVSRALRGDQDARNILRQADIERKAKFSTTLAGEQWEKSKTSFGQAGQDFIKHATHGVGSAINNGTFLKGWRETGDSNAIRKVIWLIVFCMVGASLMALLNSYWFFFAFIFWAFYMMTPADVDIYTKKMDKIKNKYLEKIKESKESPVETEVALRFMEKEMDVEAEKIKKRFEEYAGGRTGRLITKTMFQLAAFFCIVTGLLTSGIPLAKPVGLVVGFLLYM